MTIYFDHPRHRQVTFTLAGSSSSMTTFAARLICDEPGPEGEARLREFAERAGLPERCIEEEGGADCHAVLYGWNEISKAMRAGAKQLDKFDFERKIAAKRRAMEAPPKAAE